MLALYSIGTPVEAFVGKARFAVIFFGSLLVLLIFVLSIISGIFPAFVLAYLKPVNVLKGDKILFGRGGNQKYSGGMLRKFLVTIQYVVTIGMIISTIIIFKVF